MSDLQVFGKMKYYKYAKVCNAVCLKIEIAGKISGYWRDVRAVRKFPDVSEEARCKAAEINSERLKVGF